MAAAPASAQKGPSPKASTREMVERYLEGDVLPERIGVLAKERRGDGDLTPEVESQPLPFWPGRQ
jgi:hypothetical protein